MRKCLVAGLFCILGEIGGAQANSLAAWQSWVEGLSGSGYIVAQGGVFTIDNAACAEIVAVFGSCFGNNAAAPYIVPQPPIGDTYVDPDYATPFTVAGATGTPSNMFFRLANNDALVTILRLPPKAAYLGYQSYVFTSEISNYPTTVTGHVVSPDPSRYEIFGSMGNNINNVVVARQLGKVWNNQAIVYITTANRKLGSALVANAKAHGFDSNRIYVEPVGANVETGSAAAANDLVTLIRYALPKNVKASAAWTSDVTGNVLSYRVSAAAGAPVVRFQTPNYTRKIADSETGYQPALQSCPMLLRKWLIAHEGRPVALEKMITSEHVDAGASLTDSSAPTASPRVPAAWATTRIRTPTNSVWSAGGRARTWHSSPASTMRWSTMPTTSRSPSTTCRTSPASPASRRAIPPRWASIVGP